MVISSLVTHCFTGMHGANSAESMTMMQARMLLRWRLGAMQLLEARETLETKAATRLSLLRQTQMLAAWRNAAHLQALLQAMLKHAVATLQVTRRH